MTHVVVLRHRAEDDIRTIAKWYESRQAGLGEQFLVQLGKRSGVLRNSRWRARSFTNRSGEPA